MAEEAVATTLALGEEGTTTRLASATTLDIGDGQLLFLEVNNGPMFAAFDRATNGELCRTMIETLLNGHDRAAKTPTNNKKRQ